MFSENVPANAYIKFKISEYLRSITPNSLSKISDPALAAEIVSLAKIRPHVIITVNFDLFEMLFPTIIQSSGSRSFEARLFQLEKFLKSMAACPYPKVWYLPSRTTMPF